MLFLFIGLIVVIIVASIIIAHRNKMKSKVEKSMLLDSIGQIASSINILYAESYWDNYLEKYKVAEEIDRHTWQNLDMNEVYQRVNACQSEPEDNLLYKRLRMQANGIEIEQQEKLIAFFSENPSEMIEVMYDLKQIGRNKSYTTEILTLLPEVLETKWRKVVIAIAFVPLFSVLLSFFLPQIGLTLLIISLFANLIITYFAKAKNYSYQVAYPLSALVYWSKKALPYIEKCDLGIANELRKCHKMCKKIELPFEFMRRSDAFESIQIFDVFGLFLLPVISYYFVADFVKKETSCLIKLYDLVGEIDVACSVYSYRKSAQFWCEPQYIDRKELMVKSICHPLI